MTRYLTTRQYAHRVGKALPTVKKYVSKITGARKVGRDWWIPEGAPWPTSGKPGRPRKALQTSIDGKKEADTIITRKG